MMSEKRLRFTMESDKLYSCIFDNGNELTCFELVDLLNEQSDTIEGLILDKYRQEEKLDIARRNLSKQLEKIDEQQARIEMLEKGILNCLFGNKSIGMFAEEMGLVDNG